MEKYVIIVAGGRGSRMKSEVPKQFLLLAGKPVLMHTIEIFYQTLGHEAKIIVVLPPGQHQQWQSLCSSHQFTIPHHLAEGGKERYFSVKNGLTLVEDTGVVAIHDGVRPAVSSSVINHAFKMAAENDAAVPVIQVTDSLRQNISGKYMAVNRDSFFLVQTPQVFSAAMIKLSYQAPFRKEFTDDASVWEYAGKHVHFIEGNKENIKITEPFDLEYMEWLKTKKSPEH